MTAIHKGVFMSYKIVKEMRDKIRSESGVDTVPEVNAEIRAESGVDTVKNVTKNIQENAGF